MASVIGVRRKGEKASSSLATACLETRARVSLLAVNKTGYLCAASDVAPGAVAAWHAAELTRSICVIRATRGVLDTFAADRVWASWNAARAADAPPKHAARCAVAVAAKAAAPSATDPLPLGAGEEVEPQWEFGQLAQSGVCAPPALGHRAVSKLHQKQSMRVIGKLHQKQSMRVMRRGPSDALQPRKVTF
eukprot:gene13652-10565_t